MKAVFTEEWFSKPEYYSLKAKAFKLISDMGGVAVGRTWLRNSLKVHGQVANRIIADLLHEGRIEPVATTSGEFYGVKCQKRFSSFMNKPQKAKL
jgi:hypothetical protein